jgi:hypothetical protein
MTSTSALVTRTTPVGAATIGTVTKYTGGRLYIRRGGSGPAKPIQLGTRINVGDQLLTAPTGVRALVFENSQGRVEVNKAAHVSSSGFAAMSGGKLSQLALALGWVTIHGTKITNYSATIDISGQTGG